MATIGNLSAPRGQGPVMHARDGDVVVQAGPVTLVGEPELVEAALGERLSTTTGHAKAMSREEDHVMTGVYVGVGLLLAAGAGYLAWRYLLDEQQKAQLVNKSRDLVADGATKAKRALRDAKGRIA